MIIVFSHIKKTIVMCLFWPVAEVGQHYILNRYKLRLRRQTMSPTNRLNQMIDEQLYLWEKYTVVLLIRNMI